MDLGRQNASATGFNTLFGNNQPQQTTTSLFGQNTAPANTNTTSLFGNNTNQQQAQPQQTGFSLFNTPANNQPQPQQSNALFQNLPQPKQETSSLFSNLTSNTTSAQPSSFFGNPQQSTTSSLFPTTMNQPSNPLQNPNLNQQNQYQPKNNVDNCELEHIIQNFINSINTYNAANAFKYMLYTRLQQPQQTPPDRYFPYVLTQEGSYNCIDYNLWLKAIQENPDPSLFIPIQISSPKQFVQFLRQTEVNLFHALNQIIQMQKHLEVINVQTFNEVSDSLAQAKQKKEMIKQKLLSVTTKMARLGIYTGYAEKNPILEKQIENNITSIKQNLNEDCEFMQSLRSLKNGNCEIGATTIEIGDYMKDMNKVRLEKNVNALRQMKQIIDMQFNNINNNLKIINGIQGDLNHYSRYGKFK